MPCFLKDTTAFGELESQAQNRFFFMNRASSLVAHIKNIQGHPKNAGLCTQSASEVYFGKLDCTVSHSGVKGQDLYIIETMFMFM